MGDLRVRTAEPSDRGSVAGILGSTTVVAHGTGFEAADLPPYSPSRMVA
jgi:hypothetical protein